MKKYRKVVKKPLEKVKKERHNSIHIHSYATRKIVNNGVCRCDFCDGLIYFGELCFRNMTSSSAKLHKGCVPYAVNNRWKVIDDVEKVKAILRAESMLWENHC